MAEIVGNGTPVASAEPQRAVTEVVWSDTALDQLEAIAAYIEQFNPSAAPAPSKSVVDSTPQQVATLKV